MAALEATDRLFSLCEIPDVGDPETFLKGVAEIFYKYPVEVMEAVTAATALPAKTSRPRLADVRKACDEAYEPIARQLARDKLAKQLPPWEPSAEERERVAKGFRDLADRLRNGPRPQGADVEGE